MILFSFPFLCVCGAWSGNNLWLLSAVSFCSTMISYHLLPNLCLDHELFWFTRSQVSLENGMVQAFDKRRVSSNQNSSLAMFTLHAHEKAVSSVSFGPCTPNVCYVCTEQRKKIMMLFCWCLIHYVQFLATASMDKTVRICQFTVKQSPCVCLPVNDICLPVNDIYIYIPMYRSNSGIYQTTSRHAYLRWIQKLYVPSSNYTYFIGNKYYCS